MRKSSNLSAQASHFLFQLLDSFFKLLCHRKNHTLSFAARNAYFGAHLLVSQSRSHIKLKSVAAHHKMTAAELINPLKLWVALIQSGHFAGLPKSAC